MSFFYFLSQLTSGFIVLEHDLYAQTVDLATGYTLPTAMAHKPAFNVRSLSHVFLPVCRLSSLASFTPPRLLFQLSYKMMFEAFDFMQWLCQCSAETHLSYLRAQARSSDSLPSFSLFLFLRRIKVLTGLSS